MDFLQTGLDVTVIDSLVGDYIEAKKQADFYTEQYREIAKSLAAQGAVKVGESKNIASRHGDLTVQVPTRFRADKPAVEAMLESSPNLKELLSVSYNLSMTKYESADMESRKLLDSAFTLSDGQPQVRLKVVK